jgi:tripartite-type tricarboxylate transporter receptor subunit TctC
MYKAWLAPYQFERPFALPPNTPANIVKAYRDAWNATMADEAFLADARQAKLEIRSVTGETTEKLVKELLAMPASAKQSLSFLVTGS